MQQAIAGVSPSESGEVTIMSVWPSMASTPIGRLLGQLFSLQFGIGNVLTVGNFIALATIPLTLGLFLFRILPFVAHRYRLTNRRVVVERWLPLAAERWVSLDEFDAIEVVVQPGQDWYPAGDLVFRKGPYEKLRLSGITRPETFRQVCLKAQQSHVYIKRDMERQRAVQPA